MSPLRLKYIQSDGSYLDKGRLTFEQRMNLLRKVEKYQVKLTLTEAFTSSFKALVGIGILSAPNSFKDVGLYGGISGTLIVTFVTIVMYTQLVSVMEVTASV